MNSHEISSDNTLQEERLEILYRELELAIRWKRPSILFAICRSEHVRDRLMESLTRRLRQIGKTVYLIHRKGGAFPEDELSGLRFMSNVVIFVASRSCEQEESDYRAAFAQIDRYREYFIDNSLHAIFWLCEREVRNFVLNATESWYLRHRVVDFTEDTQPLRLVLETLEEVLHCQGNACEYQGPLENWDEEVRALLSDLMQSPSHTLTLIVLGLFCLKRGDFQEARKFLKTALEISQMVNHLDQQSYCLKYLAMVEYSSGEMEKAIELYKRAISLSAKPARLWKNLGELQIQQHHYQEAIDSLQTALRIAQDDPQVWFGLGEAYLLTGLQAESRAALEKAIQLNPTICQALVSKGKERLERGDTENARKYFQASIDVNPNQVQGWLGLAEIYTLQGKPQDALQIYRKAVNMDQKSREAWERLGKLYLAQKDYPHAVDALEQRLQLDPESWEAYRDLAIAEFERGNYHRASYLFEQAIALCEDNKAKATLWEYLAQTQLLLENNHLAVRARQQAAKLSGDVLAGAERDSHVIPEKEGDTKTMLEPTHVFENRSAQEWNELGNSFMKAGQYQKAIYAFTKAIETSPETSWPYIKNISLAYYFLGKQHAGAESQVPLHEAVEESDELKTFTPLEEAEIPATPKSEEGKTGEDVPSQFTSMPSLRTQSATGVPFSSRLNLAEEWNERGNQYLTANEFQKAIAAYKQAIALNPKYGKAYVNLGLAYFRQGNYSLAAHLYKKGLDFLSDSEDRAIALARLGDVYRRLNDQQNALHAYQEAQALSSQRDTLLERARRSLLTNPIG
ncbi:MAG: tetratricopeptide repeat protein [Anaerolineales bacterium]|nr:tetratricopeptide repeat protein [Anaerolineales bacterium]